MNVLRGISNEQLLRRVMMNMRKSRAVQTPERWVTTMRVFGLGSTAARHICCALGFDPDEPSRKQR